MENHDDRNWQLSEEDPLGPRKSAPFAKSAKQAQPVAPDLNAQRRSMFEAFSEVLTDGNTLTPNEIADRLIAARPAAPAHKADLLTWEPNAIQLSDAITMVEKGLDSGRPEAAMLNAFRSLARAALAAASTAKQEPKA